MRRMTRLLCLMLLFSLITFSCPLAEGTDAPTGTPAPTPMLTAVPESALAPFNVVLPEDAHMLSRITGFFSGMGSSFVAIALVVLLRRRLLGEARAKDSELAATDERGQLIALKAQSVLALCVTFSMCAMLVVATVRGDTLYMLLGAALLLLSAAGKAIAAHIYGKQL